MTVREKKKDTLSLAIMTNLSSIISFQNKLMSQIDWL